MEPRIYVANDWYVFDEDVVTLIGAANTVACPDMRALGWGSWAHGEVYVVESLEETVGDGRCRVLLLVPKPGTDEILGYYAVGRLKEIREWSENCHGKEHRRRVELRRALEAVAKVIDTTGLSLKEIGVELARYRRDMEVHDA